jgi:hypothetical protein
MERVAIAIIKGGLGNQLFIYAAGRAFALRTGREYYVDDRRGYTHDHYGRTYRLNHFSIQAKTMPEEWRIAPSLKHLRHKAIRAWNKFLPKNWRNYITQRWDLPPTQLTQCRPSPARVTLNGYWQDEALFSDFADQIRQELTPRPPTDSLNLSIAEELQGDNTVFVHARRVRYPILLPAEYYRDALAGIRERITNPKFLVFSDDFQWARDHIDFMGSPVHWIEHNIEDEVSDLWLMTKCRHAIIANSSFSWWGAWLGGEATSDRVIFTPDHPQWTMRPAAGWRSIPFKA